MRLKKNKLKKKTLNCITFIKPWPQSLEKPDFFYWKVILKRKINLKRNKKIRIKLEKILKHKFELKNESENIRTFTKESRKKI